MTRFIPLALALFGTLTLTSACGGGDPDEDLGPDAGDTATDGMQAETDAGGSDTGGIAPPDVEDIAISQQSTPRDAVALSWQAAEGASGYRVAHTADGTAPSSCTASDAIVAPTATTSIIIRDLTLDQRTTFRVCSANDRTPPDISAGVTIELYMHTAEPPEPRSLTINNVSENSANVTWTSGGSAAVKYQVAYQPGSAPATCFDGTSAETNSTSFPLTGLDDGQTYGVRVCAINGDREPLVSAGVTRTFTTRRTAIPEVSGLTCSNFFDAPRVHWTGGTTQYYWLERLEGFEGSACDDRGAILVNGSIGANSRSTTGSLGQTKIVWICGVDSSHPDGHTVGKRISVRMPSDGGGVLIPGSCTPLN